MFWPVDHQNIDAVGNSKMSLPRETRKRVKRAKKGKLNSCADLAEEESAMETWE